MPTVAILQARMGSTRLPGKILMDLAGEPMLARVVERTRRAQTLDRVVVATSDLPADDVVEALCRARGWDVFRGSEADTLDRYYQAARAFGADPVVRVTGDCPLIEPTLIDETVRAFHEHRPDFASTYLPARSLPLGLDHEVFSFATLERCWREDTNPAWREHVTCYVEGHPELFRTHNVVQAKDRTHHRWTVDTAEDLDLVRRIYAHFGHDRFSWLEVEALLEQHPDWLALNRHVVQRTVEMK